MTTNGEREDRLMEMHEERHAAYLRESQHSVAANKAAVAANNALREAQTKIGALADLMMGDFKVVQERIADLEKQVSALAGKQS